MITDIKNVNTKTDEGKLLVAAIAKITTESQLGKTPYEVLDQLNELAKGIPFEDSNVMQSNRMITDEKIFTVLGKLNDCAVDYDISYGLPITYRTKLCSIVRNWLEENGLINKETK